MSAELCLELRRHPQGVRQLRRAAATSTCDLRKGEFVCFLGPSGCGKTTLLRIIAGLEVQTAGEIWQAARDISRLPPAQRDYGIVFQTYALFPNLTRRRQRRLRAGQPQDAARADRRSASTSCSSWSACRAARGKYPGAAVGRPAAAHRAGARARHVARAAAARRAAVGARRARARAAAPGDPRAAAQARRHDDHGHARPGRGAVGGRPHRRDEPRRDRAGRHADGGLPRAGDALRRRLRRQDQRAAGAGAPGRRAALRRAWHRLRRRATARRASTCGPKTCWRGRSPTATRTSSTPHREDRVPRLVLPRARGLAGARRRTRSPCTCRSTSWPSSRSRWARRLPLQLLPERMQACSDRGRRAAAPAAAAPCAAARALDRPHRARSRCCIVALLLVAFLALPLLAILLQAVQDSDGAFVGLANFIEYAETPALLQCLWNSLWVSAAGHADHGAAGLRLRLRADAQLHAAQGAVPQHHAGAAAGAVAAVGASR